MKREIDIPEDFEVSKDGNFVTIEKDGEVVEKKLKHPLVMIRTDNGKITIEGKKDNKNVKSVIQTFVSKIENSISGLEEPYEYELTLYYRHFPMDVKVQNGKFVVENFLGEKKPREVEFADTVSVETEEDKIYVRGADKELVGQTAANIESNVQAPSKRDRRVFQDGIYITKKPER